MTNSPKKKPARAAQGSLLPSVFERMDGLGARGRRRGAALSLLIAMSVHAGGAGAAAAQLHDLSLFAQSIQAQIDSRLKATVDLDEVEPEPEPEEEPEVEEAVKEPEIPAEPTAEEVPTEEAPPAAAEAGKVITSEPEEPLDLTGDGFISGTGTRFAGGVTASSGTSDKAVRDGNARAGGVEGAKGKTEGASGPPAVDLSRPAGLPIGANWRSCGFPPEAEPEGINQAIVRVVVIVGKDGRPTSVNVLSDPGYGFARVAQRCAMRFPYPVGLDKLGNPIAAPTKPFAIHFTR